jgi:HSP20 family protein
MLLRFDPFRDLDRLAEEAVAPATRRMPMDAVRRADKVVITFDLPGVDPDGIDLTVEDNTLTLRAVRTVDHQEGEEVIIGERFSGTLARQLFLGENLDTDRVEAHYADGVLTVTVPVAEKAKPRRVAVNASGGGSEAIAAHSSES